MVRVCSRGHMSKTLMIKNIESILEKRKRSYSFENTEIERQIRNGKIVVTSTELLPKIVEDNCLVINFIHVQTLIYRRLFDDVCYNGLVTTTKSTLTCYVSDDYLSKDFVKDASTGFPPTLFIGYMNMI